MLKTTMCGSLNRKQCCEQGLNEGTNNFGTRKYISNQNITRCPTRFVAKLTVALREKKYLSMTHLNEMTLDSVRTSINLEIAS